MRRTVKRVIDGDTFEVKTKIGTFEKVRIANYNAPELNQKGGTKAKNDLKKLIEGKEVTLVTKGTSYDRVVADVRIKRKKVSNLMSKKK
jgi:endonuclease YncB( thermonuclease family)